MLVEKKLSGLDSYDILRANKVKKSEPKRIPFNKPFVSGKELEYLQTVIANSKL